MNFHYLILTNNAVFGTYFFVDLILRILKISIDSVSYKNHFANIVLCFKMGVLVLEKN